MKDLRQFLKIMQDAGPDYYVEVKKPLSPNLGIGIIQQKLAKAGKFPVLYCPKIEGSEFPLVSNLFANYEMLGIALGLPPGKINKAEVFKEYQKRETDIKPTQMVSPSEAPVKEVIIKGDEVDLGTLPIVKHAKLNSGKYITIGSMVCKDPVTGIPNVGVYRHEVKGKNMLGCMVNPAHHGGYIARRYGELGKPMEVAIFIGHHPAAVLASSAVGDINMNEFEVMGGLLGESLQLVKGETVNIPVPAYAEMVIEGVIDTSKRSTDGPFSEYTGYYGEGMKPCYIIQVTAITMRKDAIYHDIDTGGHQEFNFSWVLPYESNVYHVVKRTVPSVRAVHFPLSGACNHHIYVSISKRVPGEGKFAALAALTGQLSAKLVVVVDEDIDIYNEQEVLWAVATRMRPDRDITIIPEVLGAQLDPTNYDENLIDRGHMTSKIIIDATKPVNMPFPTRVVPSHELWESMKLEDYL